MKNYFYLSNFSKINLENKSWFNDKSKDAVFQDITNFIDNSMNEIYNKSNTSKNFLFKNIINENIIKSKITQAINNFSPNKSANLLSNKWKTKVSKSVNMSRQSDTSNINSKYYPKIIIKSPNSIEKENRIINYDFESPSQEKENQMSIHNQSSSIINTTIKLSNRDKNFNQYKPSKFKELKKNTTNKDISDQDSLELTMEEDTLKLNNLKNDIDTKLREKIKSSVKRNKILKLSEIQNNLINLYQEEINSSLSNDEFNSKIINKFKKISELSNTLHNNLLEYMETDDESEGEKKEKQTIHKNRDIKKIMIDKNINFKIEASYFNVNNLTNGQIIKNKEYKNDIKYIIEKYINTKKLHSFNMINDFIKLNIKKNLREENVFRKNLTKNENNNMSYIDNLSFVFNKIIKRNTKQNKKRHYIKKGLRHSKTNKSDNNTGKFVSNQIKKTKTNNKNAYKNFKYEKYDGKSLQLSLTNNRNKRKNNRYFLNYSLNENINENNSDKKEEKDSSNIFGKIARNIFTRLNWK